MKPLSIDVSDDLASQSVYARVSNCMCICKLYTYPGVCMNRR